MFGSPRFATITLAAVLFTIAATPAAATTFTRTARYPEPLWDVINPADAIPDGTGAIWVADYGHHRTVLIEPSGREIVSIGWRGVQTGLGGSVGLAPAGDGSIWVSSDAGGLKRFSRTGELLATVAVPYRDSRGPRAGGIDVDPDGNLYVAETGLQAVYKIAPSGEVLHEFGRADGVYRTGPGEFAGIADVSVDASGNVWTAEDYNSRIQKIGSDGTPLLLFKPKNAAGVTFKPVGLVALPNDEVIVSGNGLVVRVDSSGNCLQTYFASGSASTAGDVSVGDDGTIYWTETGTGVIRVIAADGTLLDSYSRKEDYREQFKGPRAVAVSRDGRVAVTQSDTTLRIFRPDGSTVATMTLTDSVSAWGDRALAFDEAGRLWLCDDMTNAVFAYSPQGRLLTAFGGFWNPTGIAFTPSGDFYVADAFNHVLKRFDSRARQIASWRSVPDSLVNYVYRQNVAVDRQSDVFVTQQQSLQSIPGISRYAADGTLEAQWRVSPAVANQYTKLGHVAVDRDGSVWVCEPSSARIQWFTRDGVLLGTWTGPAEDPFAYPEGIAFDPEGHLWVTDKTKNTLEEYEIDRAAVKAATTMRIDARAVSAYRDATITGVLSNADGGLDGKSVMLERSFDGVEWRWLATVDTVEGEFAYKTFATRKAFYRAVFRGDAAQMGSTSKQVAIAPRVIISAPTVPDSVARGRSFDCRGDIRPRHRAGTTAVTIECYFYETDRWVLRKRVAAQAAGDGAFSTYSARLSLPSAGRWRIRAVHAEDAENAQTVTGWRYVAVR